MKDIGNCPYCQAEERGYSENWGMSNEGWEELERIHLAEHCAEAVIGASETISHATIVSTSDVAWNPNIPWDFTTTNAPQNTERWITKRY